MRHNVEVAGAYTFLCFVGRGRVVEGSAHVRGVEVIR